MRGSDEGAHVSLLWKAREAGDTKYQKVQTHILNPKAITQARVTFERIEKILSVLASKQLDQPQYPEGSAAPGVALSPAPKS